MKKAKLRENIDVCEIHHVIPSSLGGDNKNENLVRLTPREHFIAHALLTKMVHEKKHKRSMSYAFVKMKSTNNKQGYSRIGNGKLYELIKTTLREEYSGINNPFYGDHRFRGSNNPFYGKKHSERTKDILREKNLGKHEGDKNHFYGRKHKKETKQILSEKNREPVQIVFKDGKIATFYKKKDIGDYLGISTSLGVQLCSIKRHLWGKYDIKEILNDYH